MKRTIAIASAFSLLTLSACTSGTDGPRSGSEVADSAPQAHKTQGTDGEYAQTEADAPAVPTGASSYTDDGTGRFDFGSTATFPSGMELTIDYLGETKLSERGVASDCNVGDPVAVFEMTISNHTGSTTNPSRTLEISGEYYKDGDGGAHDPMRVDSPNVVDQWQGKKLDNGMSISELPDGESATVYAGMCRTDASNDVKNVYGTFANEEVVTPFWATSVS